MTFEPLINWSVNPPQELRGGHIDIDEVKMVYPYLVLHARPYLDAKIRYWPIIGVKHRWFIWCDYRDLHPSEYFKSGRVVDEWPGYGLNDAVTELILGEELVDYRYPDIRVDIDGVEYIVD